MLEDTAGNPYCEECGAFFTPSENAFFCHVCEGRMVREIDVDPTSLVAWREAAKQAKLRIWRGLQ